MRVVSGYAGTRYQPGTPAPSDAELFTEYLLKSAHGIEYKVRLVRIRGEKLLFLERLLERDGAGQPRLWEIVLAAVAPDVPKGYRLALGVCCQGDRPDADIFAFVENQEDEQWLRRVRSAWRANGPAQRFEPVSPGGLECENEDYGKD